MVHESQRQIAGQRLGQEAVHRLVQVGNLVPAGPRDEQRRVPRKIGDGLPRARVGEPECLRRLRHDGGPVEVQHDSVAQDRAREIMPGFPHQDGQRQRNVAGGSPQADPVLVDPQGRGVLTDVLQQRVKIRRRLPVRVGDGHQPRGRRQLRPGDGRSHLLELAAEHLLHSRVRIAGHEDDRRRPRSTLRVRWRVEIHRQSAGAGRPVFDVPPDRHRIHAGDLVDHPALR